jgi:hypothetical protein
MGSRKHAKAAAKLSRKGDRINELPKDVQSARLGLDRADTVRRKLAQIGIEPEDVRDAVRWARSGK